MPTTPIHAARTVADSNKIVKLALRSARRVAGSIRARMMEEFRGGTRFQIKPYVRQQLEPLLNNVLLAGHLSGFRRFHLMLMQEPSLKRRVAREKESLQLSAFDDAVKILQRRAKLDLNELQNKYHTHALKILDSASDDVESALRKEFEELTFEGVHKAEAIRRLAIKFDKLGLTPNNSFHLETIFRTQTQLAYGAGKWQAEQSADFQEILWGYKYVTVGDDRVRDSHVPLDGVTLPKEDSFWLRFYPPNGWNCRCQAIPIFEQREIVKPESPGDGTELAPDKGFDFNPGIVFK